jgi:probable phosphoglycerate mutase
LRNTYLGLRHGPSEANLARIIACDLDECATSWGLAEGGQESVRASVLVGAHEGLVSAHVRIVSSGFLRARQSAEAAREALGAPPVDVREELRERDFGALDKGPEGAYEQVWEQDERDPRHHAWAVESVEEVCLRVIGLVGTLEAEGSGEVFLLVSHGDVLRILECWMQGTSLARHHSRPVLAPAGLRALA